MDERQAFVAALGIAAVVGVAMYGINKSTEITEDYNRLKASASAPQKSDSHKRKDHSSEHNSNQKTQRNVSQGIDQTSFALGEKIGGLTQQVQDQAKQIADLKEFQNSKCNLPQGFTNTEIYVGPRGIAFSSNGAYMGIPGTAYGSGWFPRSRMIIPREGVIAFNPVYNGGLPSMPIGTYQNH